MKFLRAVVLTSSILVGVNARLGLTRFASSRTGPDASSEDVEVVVVFKDYGEDTFNAMSQSFTKVSDKVEVHSMLNNLKMATARVSPDVSLSCLF